jgi:hypothetical protein
MGGVGPAAEARAARVIQFSFHEPWELAEPASGSKVLPHDRELQSRRCRPAGRYGTVDQRYDAGLCCRPGGTLDGRAPAGDLFIVALTGKKISVGLRTN